MKSENTERLDKIRHLNKKPGEGLLFLLQSFKGVLHYDGQRRHYEDYMQQCGDA